MAIAKPQRSLTMPRIYAIPGIKDTNYRIHRNDVQAICQDVIEALILDLFDYWTASKEEYKDGSFNIIWLRETGEDVRKGLKIDSLTTRTIQSKLKSLVDKKFLLAKRDKGTGNPNRKLYALNLPFIDQKIKQLFPENPQDGAKNSVETRAKNSVETTTPCENISYEPAKIFRTSYIKIQLTNNSEGNPPKPACSLDTVDAFASSVNPDVSPSPHPGYADRHSENPNPEDCSQEQEVAQENSEQAELSVDKSYGQPVDRANNFLPGPPEIRLKQDKILGVDSSVSLSEKGTSQEFNADNCQSEVKSQMYQNTEVEQLDVFNASARCDRRFMKMLPSGALESMDRRWLESEDGQRFLRELKDNEIDLGLWWKVLDYWHKQHQLWNWKGQDGFSQKTDVEKRREIKRAFAGWSKKPDNRNTLMDDLECFKSGLRRADDIDRTKQQVQRKEDPTRRTRTEEELAEIIAIFQANKPTW